MKKLDSDRSTITRAEALEALSRSGYLLESRIEAVLRDHEFRVESNRLIPYSDGHRRELDLWAGWARCYDFGPKGDNSLFLELVIECVNSPQPVAFITNERPDPLFERHDRWESLKLVGNPPEPETSPHDTWTWLASQLGFERFHHYNTKRLATQYCSFQKKQASGQWMALHRDDDHETLKKLCIATNHYIDDCIVPTYNPDGGWGLTFVYPLLVVQGELYDVRPSKRSARIVRSRHLQYFTCQEVGGEEYNYQIDVITESYLPQYLRLLFRELRQVHKKCHTEYDELKEFRATRDRNIRRYLGNEIRSRSNMAPTIAS
jgi:hypothetical protein